ncbi:hypothetical protein MCEMSEM47_01140 [Burkholderiales bacterium]
MSEIPSTEEDMQWQRRLASQANNRAWTLAEQVTRTTEENEELLRSAQAAMYLWNLVGNANQRAHATLLVAHAKALVGVGDSASNLYFRARTALQNNDSPTWERALLAAVGANVAATHGDTVAHQENHKQAVDLTQTIKDDEERAIIEATLRVIPIPRFTNMTSAPRRPTTRKSIPILRVSDAPATAVWFGQLGFTEDWRHQHEPGFPWFISISTSDGATLFLTEHEGDCKPGGAVFLVTNDIAAVEALLNINSKRMPWGDLELSLVDPDGNHVRVSQPGDR